MLAQAGKHFRREAIRKHTGLNRGSNKNLPALKMGGLYKINFADTLRFCRYMRPLRGAYSGTERACFLKLGDCR
jgi:hypothetical protein